MVWNVWCSFTMNGCSSCCRIYDYEDEDEDFCSLGVRCEDFLWRALRVKTWLVVLRRA